MRLVPVLPLRLYPPNKGERKVSLLRKDLVTGRIFRSTIEREQDTETVLLITPSVVNVREESEKLRQTENRFYRSYNQRFSATQVFDTKFVQVNKATEKSDFISNDSEAIGFTEMTNDAAQMLTTPELHRASVILLESGKECYESSRAD